MGVSVRQQKRDGKWYVHVRHGGQRIAFKYGSEDEAGTVATAFRYEISLGHLDIAMLRAAKAPVDVKQENEPNALTLKKYYEDSVLKLWEGSLSRSTYNSYEG